MQGEGPALLQLSGELVGRACKARPGEPKYAVEAGYHALLQGDFQAALGHYSQASHLHELDMDAMYGSIECDLLSGKVCPLLLCVGFCRSQACWPIATHPFFADDWLIMLLHEQDWLPCEGWRAPQHVQCCGPAVAPVASVSCCTTISTQVLPIKLYL